MNKGCCKDCGIEFCKHKLLGLCYYECSAWLPKIDSKDNEKTTINKDKKTTVKTDMVEVIRCKDCKHWNKSSISGEWPDKVTCACKIVQHFTQEGVSRYTAPDDYCSFAERVEEK